MSSRKYLPQLAGRTFNVSILPMGDRPNLPLAINDALQLSGREEIRRRRAPRVLEGALLRLVSTHRLSTDGRKSGGENYVVGVASRLESRALSGFPAGRGSRGAKKELNFLRTLAVWERLWK